MFHTDIDSAGNTVLILETDTSSSVGLGLLDIQATHYDRPLLWKVFAQLCLKDDSEGPEDSKVRPVGCEQNRLVHGQLQKEQMGSISLELFLHEEGKLASLTSEWTPGFKVWLKSNFWCGSFKGLLKAKYVSFQRDLEVVFGLRQFGQRQLRLKLSLRSPTPLGELEPPRRCIYKS